MSRQLSTISEEENELTTVDNSTLNNENRISRVLNPSSKKRNFMHNHGEKFSKSIYGILLAFLAALTYSVMLIFIKKAYLLNGSDSLFIRYLTQTIVTAIILYFKKLNIFGYKNQRLMLISRSIVGVLSLMGAYFAVTLIQPSDSTAVGNSNVIITAILSRLFMKEKFSLVHVASICMACTGVILITQPSFIFSPTGLIITNDSSSLNIFNQNLTQAENIKLTATIGFLSACTHAIGLATITLLVKKLATNNVHFSVNIFYTSMLGVVISFLVSLTLVLTHKSSLLSNIKNRPEDFKLHIFYSALSGLVGTIYMIMFHLSLKYEDAAKVSIIKTSDLFFVFIFQYIILNIKSNVLKVLGGVLIFLSGVSVLAFKVMDERYQESLNKNNKNIINKHVLSRGRPITIKNRNSSINSDRCTKLLFYKF